MKNILAKNGGVPVRTKKFHEWPYADERELHNLKEVLDSRNWWRMTGSKVEEFEEKFAKMHDVKYCLGLSNGTHAIELALNTLGIGKGDEVIVPAFTFISTATAVLYCNAEPVFADIDPKTFCMDPASFEKAITPKTKAVIPVHMAGHPCEMDAICSIAKQYGIKVIEDAAHGHGTEWNHKRIGSFGDMATFSFQNGKIVTCGEGGAIVTNDKDLYEKAYLIHGVGRPKGDTVYEHKVLGSNDRMNEFQAAVLLAQLERLPEFNERREQNAKRLNDLLSSINGIVPQIFDPRGTINSHYMYMFCYKKELFGNMTREEFVEHMNAEGIPCFVAYPAISNTSFFKARAFAGRVNITREYKEELIPNAVKVSKEVVWLPHYTLLGDDTDLLEITLAILKIKGML